MKYPPIIAGILLGLLFLLASVSFLLNMVPEPTGLPAAAVHFNEAFGPTGYMKFIKVLELLGGILVAIPRLRNFGLLVLGPIIVNILAFNIFIMKGAGLMSAGGILTWLVVGLAAYLLWVGRRAFAGLLN